MSDVVVVGAGIGYLAAALLQGRRVIVRERGAAPVPASPAEMWSAWPRPRTAAASRPLQALGYAARRLTATIL